MNKDKIKEQEQSLCYYTTMDAFVSMMENARKQQCPDNLILWASSIFVMNDSTEFYYGRRVVNSLIKQFEEENNIDESYRLFNAFRGMGQHLKPNCTDEELYNSYFVNTPKTPFVLSFTYNSDDLAMWSLYGDRGRGLCLQFDKNMPSLIGNESILSQELNDINYEGEIKKNSKLYKLFLTYYRDAERKLHIEEKNNLPIQRCCQLARLHVVVGAFIKEPKYKSEQEVRQLVLLDELSKVNFRTRNGMIVPYVEVRKPLKHLKGIIIGPSCDYELTKRNIDTLLYTRGMNIDPLIKPNEIAIKKSEIPFRNI